MTTKKGKRVIVTGGTGFLGRNFLPMLSKKGYGVCALVRKVPREKIPGIIWKKADLAQVVLPSVFHGVSTVFHLAGRIDINGSLQSPKERILDNVLPTLSLLEGIRLSGEKPLVVFTSTDRMYGRAKTVRVDELTPASHIEPYTTSKVLCEQILYLYETLYGIPFIILRVDSMYGPHQPVSMFISDIIAKMKKEDRLVTGDLSTAKNFVFVEDVGDALLSAMHAPPRARNQIYNIGGPLISLRKVAEILLRKYEHIEDRPIILVEQRSSSRPKQIEVRPFHLSTKKAKKLLHWSAKTSLVDGLERTLRYFQV